MFAFLSFIQMQLYTMWYLQYCMGISLCVIHHLLSFCLNYVSEVHPLWFHSFNCSQKCKTSCTSMSIYFSLLVRLIFTLMFGYYFKFCRLLWTFYMDMFWCLLIEFCQITLNFLNITKFSLTWLYYITSKYYYVSLPCCTFSTQLPCQS